MGRPVVYRTIHDRVRACTAEPESHTGCWTWTATTRRHGGGDRPAFSRRVPGVPNPRKVNPQRELLGISEAAELVASHLCSGNWLCCNPDHLIAETQAENIRRRDWRAMPLPKPAETQADDDPDWLAGELADPNVIPF